MSHELPIAIGLTIKLHKTKKKYAEGNIKLPAYVCMLGVHFNKLAIATK